MSIILDGTTGVTTPGVTDSGNLSVGGTASITGATTLSTVLGVAQGGTGATSLTANNVLLGNGTSAVATVAPGTSGNVLTSDGTTWQSISAPGLTLLATIATTSGTSVNSGTLNLTTYKQVQIVFNGVSNSAGSGNLQLTDPNATLITLLGFSTTATNGITGVLNIDLATGVVFGVANNATTTTLPSVTNSGGTNSPINGKTTFSTSSTIFTFSVSANAFDAGSILIYGVK